MNLSTPISWRLSASRGLGKLAAPQPLRGKSSLGGSGRRWSSEYWISPTRPDAICAWYPSSIDSVPGTHDAPCSVTTNVRPGCRSNTPARIRCHSARCEYHAVSTSHSTSEHAYFPYLGEPLPEWWLIGTPSSSHADHSRSYTGSASGERSESSGRPGSKTPPRSPASLMVRTSRTASSTSLRKICPTPARRSGACAHQSASQRLWARIPASRRSNALAEGGRATSEAEGKNGGTVFGKITSPTMPSASSSAMRRSWSQFRVRPSRCRSPNGFLYAERHSSNSARYSASRYSRYWSIEPPAWQSAETIRYRSPAGRGAGALIPPFLGAAWFGRRWWRT